MTLSVLLISSLSLAFNVTGRMETLIGLFIVFVAAVAMIAFGYDFGCDYVRKEGASQSELQLRLARLDLLSYVLTSIPLIGGMLILLGNDAAVIRLKIPESSKDFVSVGLGTIASIGIGLGFARRRWALIVLKRNRAESNL